MLIPSTQLGGAGLQARQLARQLIELGVEVHFITRRRRGTFSYEEIEGVPIHRMPTIGTGVTAAVSYICFGLLWMLRNRNRFWIIHCHQPLSPATIGILGKVFLRKKVIVKIALRGVQNLPLPGLRKHLLRLTDLFIVLNEESERRLQEIGLGSIPIMRVPNGVDVEKFTPVSQDRKRLLRDRLQLVPDGRFVVFTGRLIPRKGVDVLLRAWRELVQTIPQARLIIVGDGEEAPALQQLASELGIEHRVHFAGYQDNVVEYLQMADVFVFPSFAEGLSNSLLEAMACGLPIVTTDVEGNKEAIVDGENGLLVPAVDPTELSSALSKVITCRSLADRLGSEARRTVVSKYSLEQVAERYIRVYQQLVADTLLER